MTSTRFRQSATRLFAAFALTLTGVAAVSSTAQADQTPPPGGGTGCPLGAVCVYPDDDWNGGNPTYVFYSYGAHQIYNQYGDHRVYNNQYDEAFADLCSGSHGNSCDHRLAAGEYIDYNLTPINSIDLWT